jgi:hypothetical protein
MPYRIDVRLGQRSEGERDIVRASTRAAVTWLRSAEGLRRRYVRDGRCRRRLMRASETVQQPKINFAKSQDERRKRENSVDGDRMV